MSCSWQAYRVCGLRLLKAILLSMPIANERNVDLSHPGVFFQSSPLGSSGPIPIGLMWKRLELPRWAHSPTRNLSMMPSSLADEWLPPGSLNPFVIWSIKGTPASGGSWIVASAAYGNKHWSWWSSRGKISMNDKQIYKGDEPGKAQPLTMCHTIVGDMVLAKARCQGPSTSCKSKSQRYFFDLYPSRSKPFQRLKVFESAYWFLII